MNKKLNYIICGIVCFGFLLRFLFFLKNPHFDYTRFEVYTQFEIKGLDFPYSSAGDTSLPSEVFYFKGYPPHDSQEYRFLAVNMLKHHRFSWNSELEPVTFRVPGYPLFIAGIYSLFPKEKAIASNRKLPRDWAVMLIQVLLSTASIYLIYLIGKHSFNEWAGIIAAFFFSLDFTSIFFSSLYMSESLFIFLLLAGTLWFLKRKSPYAGLIFGMLALIRPIAFYIFIPLIFLQSNLKKRIIFLLLFFLPILPWTARNLKVYNSPLLTSIQGLNLFFYNSAALEAQKSGVDVEKVREKFSKQLSDSSANPLELASMAQKSAVKRIIRSPFRYAFIHLKGAFTLFLPTKVDDIVLRICGTDVTQSRFLKFILEEGVAFKFMVILFTGMELLIVIGSLILGIISFIRWPRWPNLFFFLIALYFFILSGVSIESRFRLPMIPYFYVMGASVISNFFKKKE